MSAEKAVAIGRDTQPATAEDVFEGFGLSAEEIASLRTQGFLRPERRGDATVYKLRFRLHGRQRVKYLGRDAGRIAGIRAALADWQSVRITESRLRDLREAAAEQLKDSKRRLAPLLAESGWKFHGRALRRSRKQAPEGYER